MSSEMTPYEARAWAELVEWRENRLTARTRRILPPAARERLSSAGRGAKAKFAALPDERLFALAVLGMGTAAEAGKAAAYIEINKLVQALARRASWDQLRQNAVTHVVEKVFARLGFRITQRKLSQAIPVIGTLLGAGMNARLLMSVVDDADHIYRERLLRERYGLALEEPTTLSTGQAEGDDVIDVVEIVEDEIDQGDKEAGEEATWQRKRHV